MAESRPPVAAFLLELDALKLVERRTYIGGGRRLENSAEHSWHVALAAWALASHLNWEVDIGKLLQLALIHDLGEMSAGDTFLYAADRSNTSREERACIARIAERYQGLLPNLVSLWNEQEAAATPEARLLRIADRLLPFLHNISSEGKTWREHSISRSQVLGVHSFIALEAPDLFTWMTAELDQAVQNGWLRDS